MKPGRDHVAGGVDATGRRSSETSPRSDDQGIATHPDRRPEPGRAVPSTTVPPSMSRSKGRSRRRRCSAAVSRRRPRTQAACTIPVSLVEDESATSEPTSVGSTPSGVESVSDATRPTEPSNGGCSLTRSAPDGVEPTDVGSLVSRLIFRERPGMVQGAWVRGRRLETAPEGVRNGVTDLSILIEGGTVIDGTWIAGVPRRGRDRRRPARGPPRRHLRAQGGPSDRRDGQGRGPGLHRPPLPFGTDESWPSPATSPRSARA